jgi:hypothetical protein
LQQPQPQQHDNAAVVAAAPELPQPRWLFDASVPPGCARWSFPADAYEPAARRSEGEQVGAAAAAAAAAAAQARGGHYKGTLVWGAAQAQEIVSLLEGGGGNGSGGGNDAARVLAFCYSNRLGEVGGRATNAAKWLDYTIVPLLVVGAEGSGGGSSAPGARLAREWRRAPHSAGYDSIGAAESELRQESAEAQLARWRQGTPPELFDRGWYVV